MSPIEASVYHDAVYSGLQKKSLLDTIIQILTKCFQIIDSRLLSEFELHPSGNRVISSKSIHMIDRPFLVCLIIVPELLSLSITVCCTARDQQRTAECVFDQMFSVLSSGIT